MATKSIGWLPEKRRNHSFPFKWRNYYDYYYFEPPSGRHVSICYVIMVFFLFCIVQHVVHVFVFWYISLKTFKPITIQYDWKSSRKCFLFCIEFFHLVPRMTTENLSSKFNYTRIKLEAFLCHLTDITQNYVWRIYGRAKIKLDSKRVFFPSQSQQ